MHALVAQVAARLRERARLPAGTGLLVAVSGGVDSMVLLHALHALAPGLGGRLVVAHFNHRLRGAASDADERFVVRAARRLGLRCVTGRGEVRAAARAGGVSVEMAGRTLRHGFLARTARKLGLGTVALAHHADDQVELFFLRLLRGAAGGLGGMSWASASPADATVMLVRPLLDLPKSALFDFAREAGIEFREDASNRSPDMLRNRIRHELLPLLRRDYQPGLDRTVPRVMEIAGTEADFTQAAARRWLDQRRRAGFARLPLAVQRQCVRLELERLGVAPEFEMVEQLRSRADVRHSWGDAWLVRAADSGRISVHRPALATSRPEARVLDLPAPGGAEFDGVAVRWRIRSHVAKAKLQRGTRQERFDADQIGPRMVLRHWRPGDRFQPSGMARAVKLQDLFTNAKVPAAERRIRIVAEAADGRLFWVEGLRISEPFKLGPSTRRELVWSWRRLAVCRGGGSGNPP